MSLFFYCWANIKEKTRIHHQHLRLGEERPGLCCKGMKKQRFNKLFFEKCFSVARMRPYFNRYSGDERKAIRHYEQNIQLAESLGPSLSVFEVTLRNALIQELEIMAGQKEWYRAFNSQSSLYSLNKYITTAEHHIIARGETITADKINGELTLGFWVSLFNAEHEKYLWKHLRRAFPNLPKSERQRKNVSAPLNAIRTLRNRVYHNEAISWNIRRLTTLHQTIIRVISWMNIALPQWLLKVDHYKRVSSRVEIEWYGRQKYLCNRIIQIFLPFCRAH